MLRKLLLLAALLVLAACSEVEPTAIALQQRTPELQPLHATLFSNLREPQRLLIRDAESWAALWSGMISTGTPTAPPYVDFAEHDVLVAAMGERRTGGYSIVIASAETVNGQARVSVVSSIPGPTCDRADIITAPVDAVRIRKVAGPAYFVEQTVTRECGPTS